MNPTQFVRVAAFVLLPAAAIILSAQLAQAGFLLPFALALGVILLAVTATFPAWLLVVCLVFSLLTGRSGIGLGYWEIFAGALIARWLCQVPFTRNAFGKIHGMLTFVCIAGFTGILILHGLPALLAIGDSVGRRIAVMAIASVGLSYLLLSDKLDTSKLKYLPWAGVLPGLISAGFDIINVLIPAALPITYFIYDGQNWELIAQYTGQGGELLRLSGFRELGLGMAFLALSYFAVTRSFEMRNLIVQVCVTAVGGILAMIAGYRNFVVRIALGILIASYLRSRATLVAVIACVTMGVGGIVLVQNQFNPFPLTVQRALSFLPADWDWRTKTAADGGIEWRADIRAIFFERIFPDSWLLGRGLIYDERIGSMLWMAEHPAYQTELFAMMQLYHSGLASSLDFVGVVGTLFLMIGTLRALWNCIVIMRARLGMKPWHVWVVLMYLPSVPFFWYTGFFERSFPFMATFFCLLELARRDLATVSDGDEPDTAEVADYEMETADR